MRLSCSVDISLNYFCRERPSSAEVDVVEQYVPVIVQAPVPVVVVEEEVEEEADEEPPPVLETIELHTGGVDAVVEDPKRRGSGGNMVQVRKCL